jgi:hypothetical protein
VATEEIRGQPRRAANCFRGAAADDGGYICGRLQRCSALTQHRNHDHGRGDGTRQSNGDGNAYGQRKEIKNQHYRLAPRAKGLGAICKIAGSALPIRHEARKIMGADMWAAKFLDLHSIVLEDFLKW